MFPACAGMNLLSQDSINLSRMFPACAGMNRSQRDDAERFIYVPRVRGDEPRIASASVGPKRCSPRARG